MSFDRFIERQVKSRPWLLEGAESPSKEEIEEEIEHELWNDAQMQEGFERVSNEFELDPRTKFSEKEQKWVKRVMKETARINALRRL